MHESARSLRPAWIGFGWFIAAALTSLLLLAFEAFGILAGDPNSGEVWGALALLLGFSVGGFFLGTRVAAAPILHGVAMGLLSVVAWIAVNLLGQMADQAGWTEQDPLALAWLLVLQLAAAVVGTRAGVRWIRRGNPEGRATERGRR